MRQPAPLRLERRRPSAIPAGAWDAFAREAGCSILCAHGHVAAWGLRRIASHTVWLFELFADDGDASRKIGQCAVGVSRRGGGMFLERLQLAPGCEARWREAMAAVLSSAGPGAYVYGGLLNLEPPRDLDLQGVRGVTISGSRPLTVQAVEFANWPNWDAYYRAISQNSRRNARAAIRNMPDLAVTVSTGRQTVFSAFDLTRLRALMTRRKGLETHGLRAFGRYLLTGLNYPHYMLSGVARAGRRTLASFYGAEFGDQTYYLEGASQARNEGAAWRLILTMLERAYRRAPQGRFVMGYVDYALHDEAVGGGLLRSRNACRVTDHPTSVVRFDYRPG